MAAPLKPWERGGLNRQTNNFSPVSNSSLPPCCQPQAGGPSAQPAVASTNPPAVPPRPTGPSPGLGGYGSMGLYNGSMMAPYGMYGGGYGGYGGYNNYGGYGGYGNYGYGGYGSMGYNNQMSSFARVAEESSRPAFQSIESIVRAFSSVSMMMDSTFQAVYNSFRAVVGVADNFSRLKEHLAAVFGAMAIFRTLRYLYHRLLELLGMERRGEAARVWHEAVAKAAKDLAGAEGGKAGGGRSSWPIIMFFAITMGGPWLFWRLMQALGGDSTGTGWVSGEEEHHVGQVLYNFKGQSDSEISVTAGQSINIAPKELQPRVRGWLLASSDGKTQGLVPANYIRVLGKRPGSRHTQEPPSLLSASQSSPAVMAQSLPSADNLLDSAPSLLPVSESESDLQTAFLEEAEGKMAPLPSQPGTQGGQCCKGGGVAQPAVGVASDSCCSSKKGDVAGCANGQEVKDMTAADILDSQASD